MWCGSICEHLVKTYTFAGGNLSPYVKLCPYEVLIKAKKVCYTNKYVFETI